MINEAVEIYEPLTNQRWAIHKQELDHSLRVLASVQDDQHDKRHRETIQIIPSPNVTCEATY